MSAQTRTTRRHFVKTIGAVGAAAAVGPFFHARPARPTRVSWWS
jgi:TAT (twin-arginine translocation) pathway signal sequence.